MNSLKSRITIVLCSLLLVSAPSSAQQSDYDISMLDFGAPDIQGVWTYETRTGLQRPEQYAELEIDEETMMATLEPSDVILDDYQNFGTNRQNDPANVGGYDPAYFQHRRYSRVDRW
ncbi:MAG: hypothetical protein GKR91_09215 [Pseudomonadales bacterium]|nr:hypothetical protein [Pseudomonadales bacterium]